MSIVVGFKMSNPTLTSMPVVKLGWRKLEKADIKLGTFLNLNYMHNGGGYNTATIIKENYNKEGYPNSGIRSVTLARPMAYAHEHFNSNSPMLSAETFDMTVDSMLLMDIEVYQGRDNVGRLIT